MLKRHSFEKIVLTFYFYKISMLSVSNFQDLFSVTGTNFAHSRSQYKIPILNNSTKGKKLRIVLSFKFSEDGTISKL